MGRAGTSENLRALRVFNFFVVDREKTVFLLVFVVTQTEIPRCNVAIFIVTNTVHHVFSNTRKAALCVRPSFRV